MHWLGLDIGGANLKAAATSGWAAAEPFPLWQRPGDLATALRQLLADAPACSAAAVTMTGELADCYATKREGVNSIVQAVDNAVDSRPTWFATTSGGWLPPPAAVASPHQVAAANWHLLARWAARLLEGGDGLVIDMGSTTTDITPVVSGRIATTSNCDSQRLQQAELVYTGNIRTPLCCVCDQLPYRGGWIPQMAEWFATTADIACLLGDRALPINTATADGRPLTTDFATQRVARCVGADSETFSLDDAWIAARYARDRQFARIGLAVDRVAGRLFAPPLRVVLAGSGEPLLSELAHLLQWDVVAQVSELLAPEISTAACAYAAAALAAEELPPP